MIKLSRDLKWKNAQISLFSIFARDYYYCIMTWNPGDEFSFSVIITIVSWIGVLGTSCMFNGWTALKTKLFVWNMNRQMGKLQRWVLWFLISHLQEMIPKLVNDFLRTLKPLTYLSSGVLEGHAIHWLSLDIFDLAP